jgi:ABC-type antimicrobial peptide transport system permease subunit
MFLFLGLIATLLALSGLFTLVSLNILKRIKEIAVRKVLGASTSNIAYKLNIQFVIILSLAILISSGVSYFIIDGLMDSIWTYHIEMNLLIFIVSGISFLLISIATVGTKVFKAASMNPVNALRNE